MTSETQQPHQPQQQTQPTQQTQPKKRLPPIVYKLMLFAAAAIWGAAFVVMKDTISALSPSWLIGVRFTLSAILLSAIFAKRILKTIDRKALAAGFILGVLTFLGFWFQTVGLAYTTPGKNAFLTGIYCVLTPFIFWIFTRKRPNRYNFAAAFICVAGVGLVSLGNGDIAQGIAFGDLMTIICGIMFALHIVAINLFAQKRDILVLTIYQLWVSGIISIVVGLFTEPMPDWAAVFTPDYIFNLVYLVVFASCAAMLLQNIALEYVAPAPATIILSLESVLGVVFSVILYGEELTLQLICGFALIFVAIILSEVFPLKKPPEEIDQAIAEDILID